LENWKNNLKKREYWDIIFIFLCLFLVFWHNFAPKKEKKKGAQVCRKIIKPARDF
jgi:hypothetical protein